MNIWARLGQHLLGPAPCPLCGAPVHGPAGLCPGCLRDLPWLLTACARCAAPLAGPPGSAGLCGRCLRHPPRYDAAFAALHYQAPVDRLVTGLKFHGQLPLARVLGGLLAERLAAHLAARDDPPPALLLPVPLHPTRLRRRGFNQALEMAREVAARLDLPVDHQACRRIRPTAPQTDLPAGERRRNVRNAFAAPSPLPARHVAILDDVVTTGHTVDEVTRALQRAGAQRVEVWALARAAGDRGR
jgi:ComF family protein